MTNEQVCERLLHEIKRLEDMIERQRRESMTMVRIGDRIINLNAYSDIYFYEDEDTKPCIRGVTLDSKRLRTLYRGSKEMCVKMLNKIQKRNRFDTLEPDVVE